MESTGKNTFGLIVGNRGFFPDRLAQEGRVAMVARLEELGYAVVVLDTEASKFGCVETRAEAKACAELFRRHEEKLDGIIVTLPNFGDERGVADAIRLSRLDVPVLVHAWQDDPADMTLQSRRDSFCGKVSVCNNLSQYGIPFSLTQRHTLSPAGDEFAREIDQFAAICRVVKGLRRCRIGALGARPAAFNTVRYSEKLLEASGISVETLDLSEAFGRAQRMGDGDTRVQERISKISGYTQANNAPREALLKMAKLGLVIDDWAEESDLDATAIQCWTSMEEFFGIVPCTLMSMMSDRLASSACETDVAGTVSMHALALASWSPSFLLDWNNNYGDEPDKCVCFHCSNLPKSCFEEAEMEYQPILSAALGKENAYGSLCGRIKAQPMTYCRVSTDDVHGKMRVYLGEGRFTDDPAHTFGGFGVAEVPALQRLLRYICKNGFEHHVAANHSQVAAVLHEAFTTYLKWDCYWHEG